MSLLRLSFYVWISILLEHTKWALLVSLTKGAVILRKLTWQGPNNSQQKARPFSYTITRK